MKWQAIVGLCVLSSVVGISFTQQFTAARAAVPVVRATYMAAGAGVNDNVAVIWLLGSDGGLKICTRAATAAATEAPACSPATVP